MALAKPAAFTVVRTIFLVGHLIVSVLFLACGVALIGLACMQLWASIQTGDTTLTGRVDLVLESLAQITVAVAALELGETILEEQVQREAHMSAPTRVRRFLSRFMVVLAVALVIEVLVLTFRFSHEAPENLPYAAIVGFAAAALIAAWGLFVWLNRSAEELEPEAMREAKKEDRKVR